MNPFKLPGPAYVSFSGGRTSAYMLWRMLQVGLDDDTYVVFANTGKEREETLRFVRDCGERWGVRIRWVERVTGGGFKKTDFMHASRNGEPFAQLIAEEGFVPHMGSPYCSTELKARVMSAFMRSRGHSEWSVAIGIRVDERRRVFKIKGRKVEGGRVELPLHEAKIHGGHVDDFWRAQPFDLALHPHEGNCDLCFKKKASKVVGLVDQDADRAAWWAAREAETGSRFRLDRPSYSAMAYASRHQVRLRVIDDEGEPCEVCA